MFPFQRRKSRASTGEDANTQPISSSEPSLSSPSFKTASLTSSATGDAPTTTNYNVLLVGQIYQDTLLYLDDFPSEDAKIRATDMEQRLGGNICNTAQVLSQFPRVKPCVMSCLGPQEASSPIVSHLEHLGITTKPCIYRRSPTPSSYILQSANTGSRTIVSCNTTIDMTKEEFARQFDAVNTTRQAVYQWVHFEGRNIRNVVDQIDWLETKATREGWRSELTISVELEKPGRPDIDLLCDKGDVVFFSKLFAQTRNFIHPKDFLQSMQPKCKTGATLFCTWGEGGAACLLNTGQAIHASAIPVHKVVDCVGAGDTFIAGIIFCLGRKLSTLTALKFSCEMASRKVEKSGFSGLAETMWKLWEASLDVATSFGNNHTRPSSLLIPTPTTTTNTLD